MADRPIDDRRGPILPWVGEGLWWTGIAVAVFLVTLACLTALGGGEWGSSLDRAVVFGTSALVLGRAARDVLQA